jgi:Leucine-rich repeat (LRR) protein
LNLADNCLALAAGWKPHAKHEGWFSGPNDEFAQEPSLDMSCITTLAGAIKDMGALLSLNLSSNGLGQLPSGWSAHVDPDSQETFYAKEGNAPQWVHLGGIGIIASAIKDMRALTKLDVSENNLHADGGKALTAGIKGNQVIAELNIAGNALGTKSEYPYNSDMSGVTALADVIPDMGALTKFDISNCILNAEGGKALAAGLKGNQVMTELNIAHNELGIKAGTQADPRAYDSSGVIAIADVIPGMGALSSLNLAENSLGELVIPAGWKETVFKEEWIHSDGTKVTVRPSKVTVARALSTALKRTSNLKELNISSNGFRADDAKILADGISGNGAMTSLNLGSNSLGAEGAKIIAAFLPKCS